MRVWAEINTKALAHNYAVVKKIVPNSKIVAMVKTNAYGHGLLTCAKALTEADYLGVATIEEGIYLRENGIQNAVLLMPGFQSVEELELIVHYQIDSVVYDAFQLDLIKKAQKPVSVWLKFETGMHRLGFAPESAKTAIEEALSLSFVKVEALMTHFASADDPLSDMTVRQINAFKQITEGYKLPLSLSNSSAILRYPELKSDYVRPGMMLYGASPLVGGVADDHGLIPVMTLKSHIIRLMDVKTGEAVGYGAEWIAERPSKIAVLSIGYGDNYPRRNKGTLALVNGHKVQVVGRTSMDYLTIDVTNVADVKLHDVVTLWGEGLPIETVAAATGVSHYSLLSDLSARVIRIEV